MIKGLQSRTKDLVGLNTINGIGSKGFSDEMRLKCVLICQKAEKLEGGSERKKLRTREIEREKKEEIEEREGEKN